MPSAVLRPVHPLAHPLLSLLASSLLLPAFAAAQAQPSQDQAPHKGHSDHGAVFNEGPRQAAVLIPGCGEVHLPIGTEVEAAQAFFDQGVGQLHGFWYFEAERSFRQVHKLDPDCAMAYWGMAMANVENADRAAGFIEQALLKLPKTEKDARPSRASLYIQSLADYYEVTRETAAKNQAVEAKKRLEEDYRGAPTKRKFKKDRKRRSRDLARGYEEILKHYPDDIEAMAFLVNRIWLNGRAGLPTTSHMAVDALLDKIFAVNPAHPAHHYRIHLWDREDAKLALKSATLSGQSSPAVAHQWHMSGHIFAKLHRHTDARWQQEASARVDHAHMMRYGVMPYQIHNYGHNNEWMARSFGHNGQPRRSLEVALNLASQPRHPKDNQRNRGSHIAGYANKRLLSTPLNFRMAEAMQRLEKQGWYAPEPDAPSQADVHFDLGFRYFVMGVEEAGARHLAALTALKDEVEPEKKKKAKKGDKKAVAKVVEAKAEKKVPAEETKDAKPAKDAKDGEKKADKPKRINRRRYTAQLALLEAARDFRAGKQLPTDEKERKKRRGELAKQLRVLRLSVQLRADFWRLAGDLEGAAEDLRKEDKKNPKRAETLARLVEVEHQLGKHEAAKAAFDRLRKVAGHGELDNPLFAGLAAIAQQYGLPADWRQPQPKATDAGERPPLSELGPLHWQPVSAPGFDLPSTDGGRVSLSDFRGRPVLVIFYLGFGCLHCVEQLQAFHPMVDAYKKAGIEVVAIGLDQLSGMQKSLDNLAPEDRFRFPLLADPELKSFKQWRCFDDFEGQTLHGTFLIDGRGRLRWGDISYEPFMEAEWLLRECQRLLAID